MQKKPWPLIFLALFQFISPIYILLKDSGTYNMSLFEFIASSYQSFTFFESLAYPIILGALIFTMKPWCYPLIMLIIGRNIFLNLHMYFFGSGELTLFNLLTILTVNSALLTYFVLPPVRAAFLSKDLRWWDQKPRYEKEMLATLVVGDKEYPCDVRDISESGVYINFKGSISGNTLCIIQFDYLGLNFALPGVIIHSHKVYNDDGYGIKFLNLSHTQKRLLKNLTRSFVLGGLKPKRDNKLRASELLSWGKRVITTGNGLTPEYRA